ncbi:MAG: cellulase family glycosylhydrolase [Pseudomonadota bacterium]|jgi:endoglucanase
MKPFRFQFPLLALTLALGVSSAEAYQVVGGKIYDETGQRVALRGVNWFGFETTCHLPHGLWARNLDDMIAQMKAEGVNAVRLPVAPNALRASGIGCFDASLNPGLQGLDSLQVLDQVVDRLDRAGIYILLDHHRPDDYAISELWYTDTYSEAQWIADLEFMAERFKDKRFFLGIDLKNEPHGRATWATGNFATDWNLAAERAAAAVLRKNPKLLVFVGGIEEQATCSSPHAHGWGGNLEPLRCMPLNIPAHKLVLAPHFYGPDVYMYSYFNAPDFPSNMPAIWRANFGFAKELGYAVVPTEFGSRYGHDGGLALEKTWFDAAVQWLVSQDLRDGFYWSWNPNSSDTGGLLKNDWVNVWQDKLAKVHELWGIGGASLPPVATAPQPQPQPAPIVADGSGQLSGEELVVNRRVDSDWNAGYCVTYTVRNVGSRAGRWQTSFGFTDRLTQGWNAKFTLEGRSLRAEGEGWNAELQPGQVVEYGYCAERPRGEAAGAASGEGLSVQQSSLSDWGAGYCKSVQVTNTTTQMQPWKVRFALEGTLFNQWNARLQVQGSQATAVGEDWNAYLAPGASAEFGYCAQR